MGTVRFVGVPRAVINAEIGDMAGWRLLGNRMLEHVKSNCPESPDEDRSSDAGPHLKETLKVRFISGADPRILIGTDTKGDVLGYLTNGTEDHMVEPTGGGVLAWTTGGQAYFSKGHMVKGIKANPFLMTAIREIAQGI